MSGKIGIFREKSFEILLSRKIFQGKFSGKSLSAEKMGPCGHLLT
jgi:hypothetical protein